MKKSEFVSAFVENYNKESKTPCTKAEGSVIFNIIFKTLGECLASGEELSITDFGSFKLMEKKETTARNPKTGETIIVPRKVVVKFRPSTSLKQVVAELEITED